MTPSEKIKAKVSLRRLAESAGVSWDRTKTRAAAGDWWAPCPFHGEKTSSFHVVEKGSAGGLFKCFGCGRGGSAVDFVMARDGLAPGEAIRRLIDSEGLAELDPATEARLRREREAAVARGEAEAARSAAYGKGRARHIWQAAEAPGDLLRAYLAARGIDLAALGRVPPRLRFAAALECRSEVAGRSEVIHRGPAMVGLIGRDRAVGVHRTWIAAEGRARLPDGAKVPKKWLGATGEIFGQPLILSAPAPRVVVGEGIETTLAGFSALVGAGFTGWGAEAALSRGALCGPRREGGALWTPAPGVAEVLILGEGSSRRPAEARALYEGARDRLAGLGLRAHLRVPHDRWDLDLDFADLAAAERRRK